jgi:hypothetical protein
MITASDKVVVAILILIAVAVFLAIFFSVLNWNYPKAIAVYGYTDPFEYYEYPTSVLALFF